MRASLTMDVASYCWPRREITPEPKFVCNSRAAILRYAVYAELWINLPVTFALGPGSTKCMTQDRSLWERGVSPATVQYRLPNSPARHRCCQRLRAVFCNTAAGIA